MANKPILITLILQNALLINAPFKNYLKYTYKYIV